MTAVPFRRPVLALALAAGLAFTMGTPAASAGEPPAKIAVKTADDLPKHEYTIEGKASEFLVSEGPFKAFVAKVKADTLSDLEKYDITDKTTLMEYHSLLQQIAILEGRDDDAVAMIEELRSLEGKESKRLMLGQVLASRVAAKKAAGSDQARFQTLFKQELAARVGALPWEKVAEEVKGMRSRAQVINKNLILGQVKAGLDPVVESNNGVLSGDLAKGLVSMRATLETALPVMPAVAEAYTDLINQHESVARVDTWTPNQVALEKNAKASPVVVCVWDSGVDMSVLPEANRWTNTKETANGKDDDGNGYIDDIHGIAFDLEENPTPDLLHPVTDLKNPLKSVQAQIKGSMDSQFAIDSPEAAAFRKHVAGLGQDDVKNFIEDLGLYGNYSHGTHVAGIAQEGNPFAKVVGVRITFDYKLIPQITPSVEHARKVAANYQNAVDYMKAAGVRAVNMSWGGGLQDIESELEKKGVGASPEERKAMAREMFTIGRDGLQRAIASAPEILFIAAAGNSDNDTDFAEMIPSGLRAPNLITIGAVDTSGKPTGFTTFGKGITLYANGFEVNSFVPGGDKIKFNGTSMAAPQVTNLAGKLLAVNPRLSTSELIEAIRGGAEPMAGYEGRFIVNPKKSLALVGFKN
jgi:subtilisin family serine protease